MTKFYNQRHSTEGNKWQKLGSTMAKLLQPWTLGVGQEVVLSRNAIYRTMNSGALMRTNRKRRQSRGIKFSATELRAITQRLSL